MAIADELFYAFTGHELPNKPTTPLSNLSEEVHMESISVFFNFKTAREAKKFRDLLTEARWIDPDSDDSDGAANQVVVRIDAGNYQLLDKLIDLACDAKES